MVWPPSRVYGTMMTVTVLPEWKFAFKDGIVVIWMCRDGWEDFPHRKHIWLKFQTLPVTVCTLASDWVTILSLYIWSHPALNSAIPCRRTQTYQENSRPSLFPIPRNSPKQGSLTLLLASPLSSFQSIFCTCCQSDSSNMKNPTVKPWLKALKLLS